MRKVVFGFLTVGLMLMALTFSFSFVENVHAQNDERQVAVRIETPNGDVTYNCCRSGSTSCNTMECKDAPPIIIEAPN